jgi:hypothetical protein
MWKPYFLPFAEWRLTCVLPQDMAAPLLRFRPIRHVLITKTDMDIGKLLEW